MQVQVTQNQSCLVVGSISVRRLVRDFVDFQDLRFDEAGIHFVDTSTICRLHEEHFNDPSPTDCISFPMQDGADDPYRMMGDVFVCPETAVKYVQSHGGDPCHELTLYVVHGLLHLVGFDDVEAADRRTMRKEEKRYLKHVEKQNLWIIPRTYKTSKTSHEKRPM